MTMENPPCPPLQKGGTLESEAGIDNPMTAPILLPDYATEEVAGRRLMHKCMRRTGR
jgi:hypothetical protein